MTKLLGVLVICLMLNLTYGLNNFATRSKRTSSSLTATKTLCKIMVGDDPEMRAILKSVSGSYDGKAVTIKKIEVSYEGKQSQAITATTNGFFTSDDLIGKVTTKLVEAAADCSNKDTAFIAHGSNNGITVDVSIKFSKPADSDPVEGQLKVPYSELKKIYKSKEVWIYSCMCNLGEADNVKFCKNRIIEPLTFKGTARIAMGGRVGAACLALPVPMVSDDLTDYCRKCSGMTILAMDGSEVAKCQ